VEALQEFVGNFTYLGIFAVLLLSSLGVPIPEEMPIIAAAVLSHEGIVRWWLALPVCLLGVLSGDMVLYWVGRHWGEQVLNWRLVRLVLSPTREQWLKAAYRRHALKTVVTARHVMGLRAAAFLTAGIARVPFWKFVVADAGAAVLGVPLGFGLAYFFTDQIRAIMADVHRAERWLGLAGLLALAAMLVVGVCRWSRRVMPPSAQTVVDLGPISRRESGPLDLRVLVGCYSHIVRSIRRFFMQVQRAWMKPGVWGAIIGSILTMIVGFSWGGWTTSSTANQVAIQRADAAVTAALVPICLAREKGDATKGKKLGELRAITTSYEQTDFVMKTGWATFPGNADPNRGVAEACASALVKTAAAQ